MQFLKFCFAKTLLQISVIWNREWKSSQVQVGSQDGSDHLFYFNHGHDFQNTEVPIDLGNISYLIFGKTLSDKACCTTGWASIISRFEFVINNTTMKRGQPTSNNSLQSTGLQVG